jgi:hypothetical protein
VAASGSINPRALHWRTINCMGENRESEEEKAQLSGRKYCYSRTEDESESQDDFSTGFHNRRGILHSFSTFLAIIPVASPTIKLHKF